MRQLAIMVLTVLSTIGWSLSSHAESDFQGFYGQVATGYENNRFSSIHPNWKNVTDGVSTGVGPSANQNKSGNPLVLGGGYFHEVTNDWLIGFGVDYAPLAQDPGNFHPRSTNNSGGSFDQNMSYQVSNRVNLSVMPAYAFAPDKLGYVKLGYSTQTLKYRQGPDASGLTSGFERSARQNGMLVGAGYKQTVAYGFYGFVEANYMSYAKATIRGDGSASGETLAFSSRPFVSAMNVLFGVGYTFDAFGATPNQQ